MEPVIYCVLACLVLLDGVPHRTLAHLPEGAVVALGDAPFTALRVRDPATPVLYFSPEEYADAVDGLTSAELSAAIGRRLRDWSPRALERAAGWLAQRGRGSLILAAAAEQAAAGPSSAILAEHFATLLDLLTRINGQGRFGDTRLDELLIFALEKEALLLRELAAAPDPARLRTEAAERAETARVIGEALGRRGQTEYAGPPPYIEMWRGVFVAPVDAALLARLKTRWEPAIPWRDGVVARWKLRDLPRLQQEGRRTTLVYLSAGQLLGDISELTRAQLDRQFTRRTAALAAAPERSSDGYLDTLRLNALLALKTAEGRAERDAPRLAAALRQRVAVGTARLAATLPSPSTPPVPGQLVAVETAWLGDMVFFAGWARATGHPTLAEWFSGWSDLLRPELARLTAMQPRP
ncbi:MAG TPA: hypothetical protein VND19_23725 [Acetobacteraceae bacterium]|nr:hypothetical protein [Acetobacteraceae bacterium]